MIRSVFICIFCLSWLSGCESYDSPVNINVSAGTQEDGKALPEDIEEERVNFEITQFEILGSDGDRGQTTENPLLDEGEFGIFWAVNDSGQPYVASFYASTDAVRSSEDIEIYSVQCESDSSCINEKILNCVVYEGEVLGCPDPEVNPVDVLNVVGNRPTLVNLILDVCDIELKNCSSAVATITFI